MSSKLFWTLGLVTVLMLGSFYPVQADPGQAGNLAPPTNIRWGVPVPYPIESGNSIVTPLGSLVPDAQTDDSSDEITINDTIEGGLKLGDTIYNSIWVGSNGYITFGHSQTSYSPTGIPGYTNGPMIAAQYDDIDPSKGGEVYIYEDDANDRVTVTWYQVAPFEAPEDGSGVNTFQIRLHGLWDGIGDGEGDFGIEFRYDTINWTRGGPGSSDYPTAGWTVGDGVTYGEVTDSGTADFITIEDESNVDHPGVFAWGVYDGGVEEIDESIDENSPAGTLVAPLTADDDATQETDLVFTLLDDDGGNFEIFEDSGVYKVRVASGATLDYETSPGFKRQIQVQAEDLDGETSSNWLDIPLNDVNEPPVIAEGETTSVTMSEDGVPTPFSLTLNAVDEDSGDTLTWSISASAGHGTASASGTGTSKDINYTPDQDYFGSDSFAVLVSDGNGGTDEITVNVTIEAVQDPPAAVDDAVSTDEDSPVTTIDLVDDNDTDPDPGDVLSVSGIGTSGTVGDVTDHGDGTFTYNPNGQYEFLAVGENTTDNFTYTINDGNGNSDTATVTVTVNGVNDSPTANDDTASTDEDTAFTTADLVAANDTDPDTSDALSVSVLNTTGTTGLVSDNGNGTFDYDPDGQFESLAAGDSTTDTFGYTITDGNGGSDSAVVTVTISGVNDPPDAADDTGATQEDTPVTVDVLSNDSDVDAGDSFEIISVTQGTHGSVSFTAADVTYTPDPNYVGSDSFTYTVEDTQSGRSTATVDINSTATTDMVINGNGISIANGDNSPSGTDGTDFGGTPLFLGTVERTFEVENLGSVDLNLTGSPRVSISGSHSGDFTVTEQPTSPVGSGSTSEFKIVFDPSVDGLRTAEVSIASDDLGDPYTFAIQGTATVHDSDGDGVTDNVEQNGDRDGDGIENYQDYDPTGYFYDERTGEVISGGSINVSGPGVVTVVEDGSTGYYQFLTDGTAGTYTMDVTLPAGYALSSLCLQGDPPAYDPTGEPEPVNLGNGENADTGFLTSNTCTTFYLSFDLEADDPIIINNNIPLERLPLPDTGFAPDRITELAHQPEEKSYQQLSGLWLEIPEIDVWTSMVGVPAVGGVWDVTWLGDRAGYLAGTAFPTLPGNTVITGHVWNADNQPGVFLDLKELGYGDLIRIHAWGQVYTYQIQNSRIVSPYVSGTVLEHKGSGDWITLFTCEDYAAFWEGYGYRRMVRAVLVEVSPMK